MNMRSITLLLSFMLISSVSVFAQGTPKMSFKDTTQYDMGVFQEGEIAEHIFEFTNTGTGNLIIKDIRTTCSCTASEWPKGSIAPGEKSSIKVTFDTNGKNGTYDKGVNIYHNGGVTNLIITATVMGKKPQQVPVLDKAPEEDHDHDHEGHDHEH